MKFPKVNDIPESAWKSAKELPPQVRELYIVVQENDGEMIRNGAYWEQDANGDWGWNKPSITHWMKWPEMPTR
jgi:hypothetical protein